MSKEKKLRNYAEDRLSAYAGGEDSLSRLKEAQAAAAPEKKTVPWRRYVMRIATSLSVLVVVVVAAILTAQGFFGGGMASDSADHVEPAPHGTVPSKNSGAMHSPAYDSPLDDESMAPVDVNAALNAETEHVQVVLPDDAAIEKVQTDEGYYYTVSLKDGSLDAIIAFDGAEPDASPIVTDKESTVAGQTLEYAWMYGITLRGKIATESETIYITHCAGADEAGALDAVRNVFTEK